MPQAGSASATTGPAPVPSASIARAPAPPAAPVATETVRRPDPGLGRGVWEAPPLLFWIVGAAALLAATGYALVRLGVLKRRRKKRT